jgi:hypothetical protein
LSRTALSIILPLITKLPVNLGDVVGEFAFRLFPHTIAFQGLNEAANRTALECASRRRAYVPEQISLQLNAGGQQSAFLVAIELAFLRVKLDHEHWLTVTSSHDQDLRDSSHLIKFSVGPGW